MSLDDLYTGEADACHVTDTAVCTVAPDHPVAPRGTPVGQLHAHSVGILAGV